MDIRGGTVKKEIKDSEEICQYCRKKAKYSITSGDKEVKVCEECSKNLEY